MQGCNEKLQEKKIIKGYFFRKTLHLSAKEILRYVHIYFTPQQNVLITKFSIGLDMVGLTIIPVKDGHNKV